MLRESILFSAYSDRLRTCYVLTFLLVNSTSVYGEGRDLCSNDTNRSEQLMNCVFVDS